MLQTIKQRVLNAIPPTVLFLVLFFPFYIFAAYKTR